MRLQPLPDTAAAAAASVVFLTPCSLFGPPSRQVKCKEEIWNMMNREWLEKQAAKKAAQASPRPAPGLAGRVALETGWRRARRRRRAGSAPGGRGASSLLTWPRWLVWCPLARRPAPPFRQAPHTPLAPTCTALPAQPPPACCRRPQTRLQRRTRRRPRRPRPQGCSTSVGVAALWAPRRRARSQGWRTCRPRSRRKR